MSEAPRTWSALDMPIAIESVEQAFFEGEAVLFREESRSVHRLGGVAGAVWLLCDGEHTVDDIVFELAEVFSVLSVDMEPLVQVALEALDRERLLVGSAPGSPLLFEREPPRSGDGPTVLAPPDMQSSSAEAVLDAFAVRVGIDAGHVVVIGVDDPAMGLLLRALLAPVIDTSFDLATHPAALVLRLASTAGSGGARTVPHLTFGELPLVRSRDARDVIRALGSILGGIHYQRIKSESTWLGLRPFVRSGRMVLVDCPRPVLLNDPVLMDAAVAELPAWAVLREPAGTLALPPALDGLAWEAAGIAPPADVWQRFELAGMVVRSAASTAEAVVGLTSRSIDSAWFAAVADLAGRGLVMAAESATGMRDRIRILL